MPDLHDDDAILASLRDHPGYQILKRMFSEKRKEYFANLAKSLSAPGAPPVDQRVIDEKRGQWNQGLWFFLEVEKGRNAFLAEIEKDKE